MPASSPATESSSRARPTKRLSADGGAVNRNGETAGDVMRFMLDGIAAGVATRWDTPCGAASRQILGPAGGEPDRPDQDRRTLPYIQE